MALQVSHMFFRAENEGRKAWFCSCFQSGEVWVGPNGILGWGVPAIASEAQKNSWFLWNGNLKVGLQKLATALLLGYINPKYVGCLP